MSKIIRIMQPLFIGLLMLTCFNCCKDKCHDQGNPDCENYDPCYGKHKVTAAIEMGATGNPGAIDIFSNYFIQDTIFPRIAIRFRAVEEGAAYTWLLGSEEIHTREFTRTFYNVPYGKYTVTLIVDKAPNTSCFPDDDGKDTVTQDFYIVENCKLAVTGIFKGVFNNEADSTFIQIRWRDDRTFPSTQDSCDATYMELINFNNTGDTMKHFPYGSYSFPGNKYFEFIARGGIDLPGGFMKIDPLTKNTYLKYRINKKDMIFNGRKL